MGNTLKNQVFERNKLLKTESMKLLCLLAIASGVTAQWEPSTTALPDERAKGSKIEEEEKAPRDCGGVRLQDKGKLNFSCKQKRGIKAENITKACKLKCGENKKGRSKDTPRKIFCKNGKWSSRNGDTVYNVKSFGCK